GGPARRHARRHSRRGAGGAAQSGARRPDGHARGDRLRDRLPLLRGRVLRGRFGVVGRRRRGPSDHLTRFLSSAAVEEEIEYTVRRSSRARHARIVVDAGGVEVVLPQRMALRHVPPLVEEKRRWIERTLRRFGGAGGARPVLAGGGVVPYLGRPLLLRIRGEPGRVRPLVSRRG